MSVGAGRAVIALSIVFVAAEIVHSGQRRRGSPSASPGWLHSRSACCTDSGSPGRCRRSAAQLDIPLALFSFNVGVEIGQLLFIASVFAVVAGARHLARRVALPRTAWARRAAPYAIGSVSAFWMIQRLAAF